MRPATVAELRSHFEQHHHDEWVENPREREFIEATGWAMYQWSTMEGPEACHVMLVSAARACFLDDGQPLKEPRSVRAREISPATQTSAMELHRCLGWLVRGDYLERVPGSTLGELRYVVRPDQAFLSVWRDEATWR